MEIRGLGYFEGNSAVLAPNGQAELRRSSGKHNSPETVLIVALEVLDIECFPGTPGGSTVATGALSGASIRQNWMGRAIIVPLLLRRVRENPFASVPPSGQPPRAGCPA